MNTQLAYGVEAPRFLIKAAIDDAVVLTDEKLWSVMIEDLKSAGVNLHISGPYARQ